MNSAAYRVNLDVMDACLEAGAHYIDLGGLYHVTAKQLEHSPRFEQRGLLALLGMGSAPGKTNLLAERAPALERRSRPDHRRRRRPRPRPARRRGRFPYALRTLLDEVTLPPMALIGGHAEEIEPLQEGPTLDFGDPIGEAETVYTLHSEVLTFGDSFGAPNVTFALSLPPAVLEWLRSLADADEDAIAAATADAAPSPSRRKTVSVHLVVVEGATETVRARSVTRPTRSGASAAASCRRLRRPLPRSACWRAARSATRGALPPEACIDPDAMFAELETRGVRFDTRQAER